MGKSVRDRVRHIVCDQMEIVSEDLKDDAHFVNDLGADSLDTVELSMEYEDEFDINVDDEDGDKMLTVNDAVAYIEWRIGGEQGPNPLQEKKRVQEKPMVRTDGL